MELKNLNPFVRFAASVYNGTMPTLVKVTDCRIFYVEEGALDIAINGDICHLEKNSLFYCCAGSIYRVQTHSNIRIICINFDLTRAHEAATLPFPVCTRPEQWETMRIHHTHIDDSPFLNRHFLEADASWLYAQIRELIQAQEEGTALGDCLGSAILKTLLLRIHCASQPQLPPKLMVIKNYIRENYARSITNQQLAALVGYHEFYLNRIFFTYTGTHLHEYLIKIRMEQAAYLIANTTLPLVTVAEQVGISSYPHFSACFKNGFGCSPSQYRKIRHLNQMPDSRLIDG